MSIDLCLVLSILVSFSIFLLVKVVFFRILPKDKSVYQIYRIFVKSWALGLVMGYFLLTYLISRFSLSNGQVLYIAFLYAVLTTLLIAVYICGIFLMIYASLHLGILSKVAGFGQKGARTQELCKSFNKNTIIKKRLQRLVVCKEITFSRGKYRLTKDRSPLLLREKIGIIVTKLFPQK